MSRAARLWSSVAALALAGALVGAPPAAGQTRTVQVTGSQFIGPNSNPDTDDHVQFFLSDDAARHTITSDTGLFDLEFTPDTPRTYYSQHVDGGPHGPRVLTLDPLGAVGTYHYHCKYHGKPGSNGQVGTGMAGTIVVKVPWKSTTTTIQSPSTVTSTSPTTPRQRVTPVSAPATSAGQGSAGALSPRSTPTSQSAKTSPPAPTGATNPSSTTGPTATTQASVVSPASVPPTTTLGQKAEPAPAVSEPAAAAGEASAEVALDETARQDGRAVGEDSRMLIVLGGFAAVLLMGGGGWAWYHRSSRYLPA